MDKAGLLDCKLKADPKGFARTLDALWATDADILRGLQLEECRYYLAQAGYCH
jgi:hypothetical protein